MFNYEDRLNKVLSQIPTERQNQVLEDLERRVNHHNWNDDSSSSSNCNILEPLVNASIDIIAVLGGILFDAIGVIEVIIRELTKNNTNNE